MLSLAALNGILEDLVRLAELEKTAQMLAEEIERTRRRVNALEYIMMPRYLETIKAIRMKLDENERGNTTRLMKVKDMMLQAQLQASPPGQGTALRRPVADTPTARQGRRDTLGAF